MLVFITRTKRVQVHCLDSHFAIVNCELVLVYLIHLMSHKILTTPLQSIYYYFCLIALKPEVSKGLLTCCFLFGKLDFNTKQN